MKKRSKDVWIQNYLNFPQSGWFSNLISILLFPLSLIYGLVMILRRAFYRIDLFKSYRLDHPVISVGNLTTGGTGKTPFEIYLIEMCAEMGLRPLLLSRGYGKSPAEPGFVKAENMNGTSDWPDEVAMLAGMYPNLAIAFGKDRVTAYRFACEKVDFDLVILDDGFQHLKIRRDLDILIADAGRPYGSGRLLPSGNLREPKSAAKFAQIMILNSKGNPALAEERSDVFDSRALLRGGYVKTDMVGVLNGNTVDIAATGDHPVGVITAIGDADSFVKMVESAGFQIGRIFQFRDHHVYSPADLEPIRDECLKLKIDRLLTTEKDAVKLRKICFEKPEIYVIKVAFRLIDGEDFLRQKIGEITQDVKRS